MPFSTMRRSGQPRLTIARHGELGLLLLSIMARSDARQGRAIVANASITLLEYFNLEPLLILFLLTPQDHYHYYHHHHHNRHYHNHHHHNHHHYRLRLRLRLFALLIMSYGFTRGMRAGSPFGYPPYVEENEGLIEARARTVVRSSTRNSGGDRVRIKEEEL